MDLRKAMDERPMSALQIRVVFICILLTMIDGFEILVMAFVAPHLAKAWTLSQSEVGYLLSAGILGMAIGSLFVSPVADFIGRRRHILMCLTLVAIGMALSAQASNLVEMLTYRTGAGIFIGALVSSLNITVSEYSSERRRGTIMGIYGVGFPAGAGLGGAISSVLLAQYDWRAPFVFGALIAVVMLIAVFFLLPESIDYLVSRRPRNALEQYRKIGAKLGFPDITTMPEVDDTRTNASIDWAAIFGGPMLMVTVLLWAAFALVMSSFYFANSWTTKLLADATGNMEIGVRAGVLVQAGGVCGALVYAALASRLRQLRAATVMVLMGGIVFTIYANSFHVVTLALVLAFTIGMFANGSIAAFYALSPEIYPPQARATGVGLLLGVSRIFAILTPVGSGYLLMAGWSPTNLYAAFGGALLLSALLTRVIDVRHTRIRSSADQ